LLLTNLCGVRDSQSLWWIAQIYLTRWKIRKLSVRQTKLSTGRHSRYALPAAEKPVLLMTAAAYFATAFLGQKLKLKILWREKLLIISQRFFGIPPFRFLRAGRRNPQHPIPL